MITEEYFTADSCHQSVVPENIQLSTPWRDVGNSKGEEGVSKPYIFKGKCAPKQEFPEGWQGGGGLTKEKHPWGTWIFSNTTQFDIQYSWPTCLIHLVKSALIDLIAVGTLR